MRSISSEFHSTGEYESCRVYTETEAHPHKQLDSSSLANYYANLCSVLANDTTQPEQSQLCCVHKSIFCSFMLHSPEDEIVDEGLAVCPNTKANTRSHVHGSFFRQEFILQIVTAVHRMYTTVYNSTISHKKTQIEACTFSSLCTDMRYFFVDPVERNCSIHNQIQFKVTNPIQSKRPIQH